MNQNSQQLTLKDMTGEVARKHDIDPRLICAIISVESNWVPWAIRYEPNWKYLKDTASFAKRNCITEQTEYILQSCSFGLMQLMGAVARDFGFFGNLTCLLDPSVNLEFGALKLKSLLDKYSDINDVISSYNAGSPRRDPVLHRLENQGYVDKVKSFM